MRKLITSMVLLATLAVPAIAAQNPSVPVIPGNGDGDACPGNGIVSGLNPQGDGFLAVKSGPGIGFQRIDKLYNGEEVYICEVRGDWIGVIYTRKGDMARCNVSGPWRRATPYTGPCLSGWAHRNWIELYAGGYP
jgi:hypothetical protein